MSICARVQLNRTFDKIDKYFSCHTHNRFTALLDFVRDYPGEPAPER